jgi:hypothetical protein
MTHLCFLLSNATTLVPWQASKNLPRGYTGGSRLIDDPLFIAHTTLTIALFIFNAPLCSAMASV